MTTPFQRRLAGLALTALLLAAALPAAAPARAARGDALSVRAEPGGVRITWRGAAPDAPADGWSALASAGGELPVRLVPLLVAGEAPLEIALEGAESRPDAARGAGDLPAAPLVLLREGRVSGSRVAVLAVSPRFAGAGGARVAGSVSAFVPGAAPLAGQPPVWAERGPGLAGAAGPTNPAFGRPAARVTVASGGVQRLSAAALAAAGVDLADPARLRVRRGAADVPVELRGSGAGLELRFYAPPPGDRWNLADTYWVTAEAAPGPTIATRDVAPGGAAARDTALEAGEWRAPTSYETRHPGPDGDHWFNATLRAGAGAPAASVEVPLAAALPAAPGPVGVSLRGTAGTSGPHRLTLSAGGATAGGSWQGGGDWALALTLAAGADRGALTLEAGATPSVVALDSATWERPVRLELGGAGARFRGLPERWRYNLAGYDPALSIYDVTDPAAPTRLTGVAAGFEDAGGRSYLVAGAGTLFEPAVRAAPAAALPGPAQALYIAPAGLLPALGPLLELRRAQGLSAAAVDVQAIYDAWSGGQVDPGAIRSFLRYAAASWPAPPAAVTLVGDGSVDPHGYALKGSLNLIPPYMAMVDPWLGETACEPCLAQLDGASPLDDPLPDLALGRLPVKSAAELEALVAKLRAYESAEGGLDWRSRAVFVADNGAEADGAPDAAGDFAALADAGAALLPAGVRATRVYYDPWMGGARSPSAAEPWRQPDAVVAREAVRAALDAGAGVVTYVGHSHHWQWAVTGPPAAPDGQFLLGLSDAGLLGNGGRLPVVLELTCLTGAFQKPAASGTTIDERLLLSASGGAAAVWGPTGLGVAYGHDALQRGFHGALWGGAQAHVGDLAQGGRLELFTSSACCQEALRTYALLGDPLTLVRARPAEHVALPLLRR